MLGDAVETGDPAIVSQLPPNTVLDKALSNFGDGFFCILPHIDSSRGAWNDLEGISRAQLFQHSAVLAAQIVNPDTKRRIEDALRNRDYSRDKPLRLIQASDYHGAPSSQPGHQHCIIETDQKLSFDTIRKHFSSDRTIRISADTIDDALKDITEGKQVVAFDFQNAFSVSSELEAELQRSLCGCLNTPASLIRLNLFNTNTPADETAKLIYDYIEQLRCHLDPTDEFSFRLLDVSYSQARQRFIIETRSNQRIRLTGGIPYVVEGPNVRPARAWEIERMVSRNFFSRYGRTKQHALVDASKSLLMISNSLPAFSIASRIDQFIKRSRPEGFLIKVEKPGYDSELEPLREEVNGVTDGDYYLISEQIDLRGGRLTQPDYYRFSLPTFRDAGKKSEAVETLLLAGNCLTIFPEGGVNYADANKKLFAPFPVFVIRCEDEDVESAADKLLGLAAYLKSSFLLWYISTIYETDDLFEVLLRTGGELPLPRSLEVTKTLSTFARNVLLAENSLLRAISKVGITESDRERRSKEIHKHNATCTRNMRLIDREVLRFLGAEEGEVREIYRVLNQLQLHDYAISADLADFLKELKGATAK